MAVLKPKHFLGGLSLIFGFFSVFVAASEKPLGASTLAAPVQGVVDSASSSQVLKVGAVLPLSGTFEATGKQAQEGLELALASLAPRPGEGIKVELKVKDNKSDPILTAQLTRELILNEHVHILVGPVQEAHVRVAAEIAEDYRTPLLAPSSSLKSNFQNSYVFYPVPLDARWVERLLFFASHEKKRTQFGLLVDQSLPEAVVQAQLFKEAATKMGLSVLLEQRYVQGTSDFNTVVQNFANYKVDTIFVPGQAQDAAQLAKLSFDLGHRWMFLGSPLWDSDKFFSAPGLHLVGHYFPLPYHHSVDELPNRTFVEAFEQKFQKKPGVLSGLFYDYLNTAVEAASVAKVKGSAVALKDALHSLTSPKGLLGTIYFRGQDRDRLGVVIMETQSSRATAKVVLRD